MLALFAECQEHLERRQAPFNSELERLPGLAVHSASIETRIADLERERLSWRESEARLNSEELVLNEAAPIL